MGTLALQITPTGAFAPSFSDIFAQLQNSYFGIYGSDAILTRNSQDGQFIAAFGQAVYDNNQAGLAVYSSYSPDSAQGATLSSLVKINGLRRKTPTQSTANAIVTGVVGSVINNGIIGDNQGLGTQWALPPSVTIPAAGFVSVVVTCTVAGATAAAGGTLVNILTPTLGWQSVTNPGAATPGNPVETDPQLRLRRSNSVGISALTPLQTIQAALQQLTGVGQALVDENDTDITDSRGLIPHSIAAVVQGGAASDIANAIQRTKNPGTSTNGTSSLIVFDQNGVPNTIRWYPLTSVALNIIIHVNALTGFSSTTELYIQQAVSAFVGTGIAGSGLPIGTNSYLSKLYSPAQLEGSAAVAGTGLSQAQLEAFASTFTINSILQSRSGPPVAADVPISFFEQAVAPIANIIVLTP